MIRSTVEGLSHRPSLSSSDPSKQTRQSTLRPAYLLEARKKFDKGEVTREQLRVLEDRAIIDAINLQRELGMKSLPNGEYTGTYVPS